MLLWGGIYQFGLHGQRLNSLPTFPADWRDEENKSFSVQEAENLRTSGTKDSVPVHAWRPRKPWRAAEGSGVRHPWTMAKLLKSIEEKSNLHRHTSFPCIPQGRYPLDNAVQRQGGSSFISLLTYLSVKFHRYPEVCCPNWLSISHFSQVVNQDKSYLLKFRCSSFFM